LSRTRKDERYKKTVTIALEVRKNGDGTYEVFCRGQHVRRRVEKDRLYEELCVGYGFCGEEYDDIAPPVE
jgi:hypothetical protein